ncbi:tetratricopeptide repeat protein [bacterium]|nr:tetratricopeptide repeat protein [bacterium]
MSKIKRMMEASIWYRRGNSCRQMMDIQGAIECYTKALELHPNFAEAWTNLGGTYGILGCLQKEMDCIEKALELNPRDTLAWNFKGIALTNLGRYAEAIACFDNALELKSKDAEIWNNKGVALDKVGKIQEALACYDTAIKINPRYTEAWNNKRITLDMLGRNNEAEACRDKAVKKNPRYTGAFVSGIVGVFGGLLALWTMLLLLGHPTEWQALLTAWPVYVWTCTWFVLHVILGRFFAQPPPNISIELAWAFLGITAFILGGILGGLLLLILLFVMPEYYTGVSLFRVIFAISVSALNCAGCFFLSIKLYLPNSFQRYA